MDKRRPHRAEFKARVTPEAPQGLKTVNESARGHEVHPGQVSRWPKKWVERLPKVFGGKADAETASPARQNGRLERKVRGN